MSEIVFAPNTLICFYGERPHAACDCKIVYCDSPGEDLDGAVVHGLWRSAVDFHHAAAAWVMGKIASACASASLCCAALRAPQEGAECATATEPL